MGFFIKQLKTAYSQAICKLSRAVLFSSILAFSLLVPSVTLAGNHPYFMAIELPNDTKGSIMNLKDTMNRHTQHAPSGCKMNFHDRSDLHITVVQLGETLSESDLKNMREAMSKAADHMRRHHRAPVYIKEAITTSRFEVWERSPYLVFRIMNPGSLTDLARTVKSSLEDYGIYVYPRMDYPDKAHTSIATYSGGSEMANYIRSQYTSDGRDRSKLRIYPPKCSSEGRVYKVYLKKWDTSKGCYENIDEYDF
jgi:2'-5' RNA ligase